MQDAALNRSLALSIQHTSTRLRSTPPASPVRPKVPRDGAAASYHTVVASSATTTTSSSSSSIISTASTANNNNNSSSSHSTGSKSSSSSSVLLGLSYDDIMRVVWPAVFMSSAVVAWYVGSSCYAVETKVALREQASAAGINLAQSAVGAVMAVVNWRPVVRMLSSRDVWMLSLLNTLANGLGLLALVTLPAHIVQATKSVEPAIAAALACLLVQMIPSQKLLSVALVVGGVWLGNSSQRMPGDVTAILLVIFSSVLFQLRNLYMKSYCASVAKAAHHNHSSSSGGRDSGAWMSYNIFVASCVHGALFMSLLFIPLLMLPEDSPMAMHIRSRPFFAHASSALTPSPADTATDTETLPLPVMLTSPFGSLSSAAILAVLLAAVSAAVYNVASFIVLSQTNPVQHSMLNALKRTFTIAATVVFLHQQVKMQFVAGAVVAVIGCFLYGQSHVCSCLPSLTRMGFCCAADAAKPASSMPLLPSSASDTASPNANSTGTMTASSPSKPRPGDGPSPTILYRISVTACVIGVVILFV